MRMMERIRTRFRVFFIAFALIFTVSVFAGLGVGFYSLSQNRPGQIAPEAVRTLVPGESAAASFNGEKIDYQALLRRYQDFKERVGASQGISNDPFGGLQALSEALDLLFTECALVQYAHENGLAVSESEVRQEINRRMDMVFPPEGDTERSASILGQVGKSIRSSSEREKAQRAYLETLGTTLTMLKQQVRRELIRQKGYERIEQEEADKAEADAQDHISKIQTALEGGEDFGELAKKYSDDTGSSEQGGLIDQMISRGFFDQAFDDVVFDMNVGSISEPIKTEFGYQIVKLLNKKAAEGPAWEAAKPTLIEQLKKEKGPDYKPSEDELKKKYESVKIQHITIRTQAERETLGRIYWMTLAAERQIYDPMILAWRAVNTEPLCFPETELKDTTLEQLARDSLLQEDADLTALSEKVHEFERVKLLRYQRAYDDPPEDIRLQFAEFNLEYGVEYEPEQAPKYPELDSLYPLGIGLVNRAIEINDKMADYHYAAAYIYSEWLDNDDALEMFPLDVEAARTAIEKELNEAIKLYENNGYYFAAAGMNYAKWVKPDQAREMLDKAEKFASGDLDLLKLLTRAYRTNGDKEKGDEYQGKALDEQRRRWEQQQGSWMN